MSLSLPLEILEADVSPETGCVEMWLRAETSSKFKVTLKPGTSDGTVGARAPIWVESGCLVASSLEARKDDDLAVVIRSPESPASISSSWNLD